MAMCVCIYNNKTKICSTLLVVKKMQMQMRYFSAYGLTTVKSFL